MSSRPGRALRELLAAATRPSRPGALEWSCLALYTAIVVFGISRHERWFDEAQAWLLARDLPYWELLARHLRYEGTPGLWHTLLYVAVRAGLSYAWVSILGGAAAIAGAYLVLRRSPFPPLVRVLIPFTFFLLFQYAVVARSYNLFAPLLFGLAAIFPQRDRRPLVFGFLLVALSHVSVHGLLVAGAIVVVEIFDRVRRRARPSPGELAALLLFSASAAFIVWELLPPPDLAAGNRSYWGWDRFAVMTGTVIHNATAESPFLSELAIGVSLYWLWRRGTARLFLVPASFLIALSAFRYHNVWHEGLVFLIWIFALWLGFDSPRSTFENPAAEHRWTAALVCSLVLVCAIQIVWAAKAISYDARSPYSGSLALARFLEGSDLLHSRIHIDGFKPVAALPYFPRNVFANLNGGGSASYWSWSTRNPLVKDAAAVWEGNPDVAILSNWANLVPKMRPPGYTEIARFPGGLYWKNRIYEPDTYVVVRRSPAGIVSSGR